jgi:hypothetical protein
VEHHRGVRQSNGLAHEEETTRFETKRLNSGGLRLFSEIGLMFRKFIPLGGGPDMQAHGRVSIGDHAAERADPPRANQPAQAAFCTTEPHPTASASAGSDGQSGKTSSSVNLPETVSPSRSLLDRCWSPHRQLKPTNQFQGLVMPALKTCKPGVVRKTAAESQSYPAHKSHLLLNDRAKNPCERSPQITLLL